MPITIFDVKGIPATRRESIEMPVQAAGRHLSAPHEAWVSADPMRGGFKVLVTGPHGWSGRSPLRWTRNRALSRLTFGRRWRIDRKRTPRGIPA